MKTNKQQGKKIAKHVPWKQNRKFGSLKYVYIWDGRH